MSRYARLRLAAGLHAEACVPNGQDAREANYEETKTQINQSSQLRQTATRGGRRRAGRHQNAAKSARPDAVADANAVGKSITNSAVTHNQRHDACRREDDRY